MTRLSRNLAFNLGGQAANLVLGLLAVKFIVRGLGDEAFGIIYFNLTLGAAITTALEFGVTSSTVREVSAHFESESGYVNGLIRTAGTLYWSLYGLLLIGSMLAAPLLVHHWLHLREISPDTAVNMLRVLSAGTLLLLPQGLYMSMLRGRQRMVLSNVIAISAFGLQQAGIVSILLAKGGVTVIITWILGSSLLELVAFMAASAHLFSWPTLLPGWNAVALRRNVVFMTHMTSVSLTSMVFTQSDKIAASRLFTVADFGAYTFAASICSRATTALGVAVADAALPSLSALARAATPGELLFQYRKLQDFLCVVAVPAMAAVVFASPWLYRYVFDPDLAGRLILPTVLLAVGFYMNTTMVVPVILGLATGRPDIPARNNAVALFVVLPITVLLIWRLGFVGGGLSWIFYHVFSYSYLIPSLCSQCIGQRARAWYCHVARISLAGTAIYSVGWVIGGVNSGSLPRGVAAYCAASAAFCSLAYRMLGPELRATVRHTSKALPFAKLVTTSRYWPSQRF